MNKLKVFDGLTDEEVIEEILTGHKELFEILIRRYNAYLFKIGSSYGFGHEDAEDLMQEAYVAVYRHLVDFENRSSFKTWIVKIMLNLCYHKKQKFSFHKETNFPISEDLKTRPMFTAGSQPSDQALIAHELRHIVEKALLRIPTDFRTVFTLRELSGLNTQETADVLGISLANVKTRLTRAKALLRTEIHRMYTPADIFEFNLIYCDTMVAKVMSSI